AHTAPPLVPPLVPVDLDSEKGIKDQIDIVYKGTKTANGLKKVVDVEYAWKPPIWTHCKVSGHGVQRCKVRPRTKEEEEKKKVNDNEFIDVHNKKK
ncbi:hypothetical protein Tco_0476774, partial [Tanacetum coccineum]